MAQTETEIVQGIGSDYAIKYGFHDRREDYFFKSGRGLSHELVDAISEHKNEPDWMRKFRHKSLDYFLARPMPTWGGDLVRDRLRQHLLLHQARPRSRPTPGRTCRPTSRTPGTSSGIPEAEKKYLAGVGAQYESEVVYHKLQEDLEKQGVIFLDMDSAPARARGASSSSTSGRSSRRTTTSSRR